MAASAGGKAKGMEPEQQERFAKAVERKKDEAEARSHETVEHGHDPQLAGEQEPRLETGRTQDERSVRDKNSGHGKKTADKWNQ